MGNAFARHGLGHQAEDLDLARGQYGLHLAALGASWAGRAGVDRERVVEFAEQFLGIGQHVALDRLFLDQPAEQLFGQRAFVDEHVDQSQPVSGLHSLARTLQRLVRAFEIFQDGG
ncbi:hypothetical protein D3C76_648820 [compost metagenome]